MISNALGADGRGQQSLILLGITLLCLLTQVTGGTALVYLTPRYDGKQLLRTAYLWVIVSAVLLAGAIVLFDPFPAFSFHILGLSILNSIWNIQAFYLLGREKNNWYNSLNFINSLISLSYLFIKWKLNGLVLEDYIFSLYVSHVATLIISLFGFKHLKDGPKETTVVLLGKFLKHGGFTQLANTAQLFKYRIHVYLLTAFLATTLLGIYSNALAIAEGVWIITRSLSVIQFARVANLQDDTEARKITNQYTWYSIGLTVLAMVVLLLFPDEIFTRIFSKEFTGLHEILLYLSIAVISLASSNIISHYFSGIGKNHYNFIGSLIGVTLTAALGYLLIPAYGLKGAAISSSGAFLCTAIFHFLVYRFTRSVIQ